MTNPEPKPGQTPAQPTATSPDPAAADPSLQNGDGDPATIAAGSDNPLFRPTGDNS